MVTDLDLFLLRIQFISLKKMFEKKLFKIFNLHINQEIVKIFCVAVLISIFIEIYKNLMNVTLLLCDKRIINYKKKWFLRNDKKKIGKTIFCKATSSPKKL